MGAADWQQAKAAAPVGTEVSGPVVMQQPFGVFVELGVGFIGLLELPEFGDAAVRAHGSPFFPAVGATITARVLQHMERGRQLRLTQRPLTADDWERVRALVAGTDAEPGAAVDGRPKAAARH